MVLKMDNTSASAPQVGLGSADMVVEELVEGGMTRLAAFYYSQIPGDVGPVRSMRASDIGIVSPVKATMVTSGAAQVTINRIDGAGIPYFTEGDKGFYRDSAGPPPTTCSRNMSETATLVDQDDAERPADYLPWGDEKDFPQGQPARTLAASFSGGHTTNWTFEDGKYVNENTYAGAGDEFPADTVLVLRVKVGDAGYRDPAGNPVPETQFTGQGQAMIFHDGRLVRGAVDQGLAGLVAEAVDRGRRAHRAGRAHLDRAGAAGRRQRPVREVGPTPRPRRGAGAGSPTPESARERNPAMMKPIATSTRSAASSGSSAVATDSPAEDIAPKKIRAKVCSIASSSSQAPAPSTERTMSSTVANVERSSCSR